jgi:hypothetical protein
LSSLKEVSILAEYDDLWTKQKYSADEVEHFKRLFGFDREGVVLITPELPEETKEEPSLDEES